jgi:hypothetical protein
VADFPVALVLDTNVARGQPLTALENLAKRGLRLRVAETALLEWGAACVRGWDSGWSRAEARQKFFGRARKLAPLLDPEVPVALDGGLLTRRIVAQVDRAASFSEADTRERNLRDLWTRIVGIGLPDEEFREGGARVRVFLDELDENLFRLAQREEELRKKPAPDIEPTLLAEGYALLDAMPEVEHLRALREFTIKSWDLSPAVAERLDAHVCTAAYRLHAAAKGARMPKSNDGADASLTLHVGAGCILVTNELQLVRIVDTCGTFQAPWVRTIRQLDDLPEVPPWGDNAREIAAKFKRAG